MNSKSKYLFMLTVALLAVSVIGVSYAHWSEIIWAKGTVKTGKLELYFYKITNPDPEFATDWTCFPGFEFPKLPPGWTWEGITDWVWDTHKDIAYCELDYTGGNTAYLDIYNAYPCYFLEVDFYPWVTSDSIPAKIYKVYVRFDGEEVMFWENSDTFYHQFDLDDDGEYEVEIKWGNNWGWQLDPGVNPRDYSPEISFWIHFLNPIEENAKLSFEVEFCAVNYNEYDALVDD